ncbi:TetR family transcriptional regulator [Streptomyces sp. BE308]|uniref:TetR/AcrR family transcriptional regulator n=1 Tax=unclassified Streptomyces TaxID=2593676 RepID=UPI002DDB2C85|nr:MULTISPECIES: TetR family transcriptional regulator [unclassified Streptomyces]MEE1794012.1 TetR family transcriptional regulator [Streptomyces sp. BE308]WRZ71516.1 TetR family transcriptional regulator [Streptomyces sp. NBC_01237]
MARTSGPETRDKLIRAAEEIFAAQGVEGAQIRDIVALAGQSNPSAVQYHFGSRAGLLDAVMAGRQSRAEQLLAPLLDALGADAGVRELLTALVTAEAGLLTDDRGRRCLRVSAQLTHETGLRTGELHPAVDATAYGRLIGRIADRLGALPEAVRLERLDLALTLIGAAMADRARQYLDGTVPLTGEDLFRADLVETTTAFLHAPVPGRSGTTRTI